MILTALRQKAVKVQNLLMDNIVISKDFIAEKTAILKLSFRAKTHITHGPVTKNYTLSMPDMRLIVMKRIDFVSSRASKKCKVDIMLFFLSLQKTNEGPDIQIRLLYKHLVLAGVHVDIELIEEMANLFPGQPTDKGAKTVNLPGVVEYMSRLWPDKKLPPTPPPPPPPPPPPKGKSKKKK
ncbi:transformation/transcription domain-associated protein [Manduca sexta]|nr:transformation/transcription domain-associated protein [Manduca sexta]KAG6463416.1 hypothetical protein O3G_MSEX013857 [Manduca sexta]